MLNSLKKFSISRTWIPGHLCPVCATFYNSVPRLLSDCPEGNVCITEMLADWFPKGEQIMMMVRKCGPRPVTPGGNKCVEENFNTHMWKDLE